MNRYMFILNPIAGGNRSKKLIPVIKKICDKLEIEYDMALTQYPNHAEEIVSHIDTNLYSAIVSIGGDGTINEIVNSILNHNIKIPLGIIPTGTGNDFARSVGIPKSLEKAVMLIKRFKTKRIDAVKLNNRHFINIASIGLDAEIAYNVRFFKNALPGTLAYIASIFFTLKKYEHKKVYIKYDNGETIEKTILLLAISNGRYYGGGMKVTPNAILDDGFLDICLINKIKKYKIPFLIPKFFSGKHVNLPIVEQTKTRTISIKYGSPMCINQDGEVSEDTTICATVINRCLELIVP